MNIIYIGTPEYACIPLEALIAAGHDISMVITVPDRPKDRGKKMQKSPVRVKAEELGLEVLAPEKLRNNEEIFAAIRAKAPDFVVVYSYGKILPKEILEAPKYACLNIHASLLPKYRGAAPIHRAILDGEEQTGVTIMKMSEGLDTGDIYVQAETPTDGKTSAMLYNELSVLGGELLVSSLEGIADGSIKPTSQDDSKSNYAQMVYKSEGEIDWSKTPQEIDRLVRAFNDFPVAWTKIGDTVIKVYEIECSSQCGDCGCVIDNKKNFTVACSGGSVVLKKIQPPGKGIMDAEAYLRGHYVEIGTKLG